MSIKLPAPRSTHPSTAVLPARQRRSSSDAFIRQTENGTRSRQCLRNPFQRVEVANGRTLRKITKNASRKRPTQPESHRGETQIQAKTFGTIAKLLLHGCQVSGMLQDHDRILTPANRRTVFRLFDHAVPANRRQGPPHRRMLIQAEAVLTSAPIGSLQRATM